MKPLSNWPIISAICASTGAALTAFLSPLDNDDGYKIPALTTKSVEAYAYFGCTDLEIASIFLISESHLRENYALNLERMRAYRAYQIRKAQTETALKGNPQLLTWVGRNEMGQSLNPQKSRESEPEIED